MLRLGRGREQSLRDAQRNQRHSLAAAGCPPLGHVATFNGHHELAAWLATSRHWTAIHHLDVPYTPGEITQRDGRGVRQGNVYSEVEVRHYLMARSFDEHRLRLVNKKANWIEQLFYGDERSMDADDSSGEEPA